MVMMTIRRAEPAESELLTGLTLRSKAYWNYDDDFMAKASVVMVIQAGAIQTSIYQVLEIAGRIVGFYSLEDPQVAQNAPQITLENLFVEPDAIGQGYGKKLLDHALETARSMGYQRVVLEADPNAESFYLKMGAERTGERESTIIPGRWLPLMRFNLFPTVQSAQSESENSANLR